MRMNRTLFFKLFFILSISLQAQTTIISGKIVVDSADEIINLDGFVIENLTSNARTKANENGLFSINVRANDELIFKQIGLIERQLKISETMIKKGFIMVHVNVEVIELAETKVKPIKKYWKDNVSKEETQSEKINKSLGINKEFKFDMVKSFYAAQYLKGLGASFRYENVLALMDMFTSHAKAHKDLRAKIPKTKYENIEFLKEFFTEYYFTNDLKIPKGNVLEFINYCYSNSNMEKFLKSNQFDEIVMIFEEKAPVYLIKINPKPTLNE